jgi:hypothetical protein
MTATSTQQRLGFPTLVPQHGTAAMRVVSGGGIKLSGLILDAGPRNSRMLLQLGSGQAGNPADPSLVQDVFFRIGGATAGSPAPAVSSCTIC